MGLKTETTVGIFILMSIGVFAYMSFRIGSFRIDTMKFARYTVFFDDISGVSKKSDVKIAGVKVGYVEAVELLHNERQVKATLMILKEYDIHVDAYAMVRQEGLLGTKYLELIPGDPLLPLVQHGGSLSKPGKEPVSVDELLQQFKQIATRVESVADAINQSLGGPDGAQRIRETVDGFNDASQRIASFATSLDSIVARNSENIDGIMTDVRDVARDFKERIPQLQENLEKISTAVDRDFNRIATQFEGSVGSFGEVAQKINEGRGILGQLVNDDTAYKDLKVAVQGLKNYFAKVDKISMVLDSHTESMFSRGEHADFKDQKGYFNLRIHPTEDYFYLAGLVGSRKGIVTDRDDIYTEWFDENCKPILPSESVALNGYSIFPAYATSARFRRNIFTYNLQIGKIFGNLALRAGIFESKGGIGVDYEVPFGYGNSRWVTTFEAWDFAGQNRYKDTMVHLKWLNRIFFTNTLYATIGIDDFISKKNKSAFAGVGIRFADDDVKYLASQAKLG